jgi:HSP20 family molecular chaperone IbpA
MESMPKRNRKVVLTVSLAIAVVLAVAWTLAAKKDLMRSKPHASGLTTLDPEALAQAENDQNDPTTARRAPLLPMFDPLDSLMASMSRPMLPLDSLMLPMTGVADDVQIETRSDRLVIELEIPGLKEASLQIKADRQSLSVSGEQQEVQEEKDASGQVVSRSESSSSYSTSFSLPEPVKPEGIQSHYDDGKLRIEIPRLYKEA